MHTRHGPVPAATVDSAPLGPGRGTGSLADGVVTGRTDLARTHVLGEGSNWCW